MYASTGQPIRGVNTWLLEIAAIEQRFRNRHWATGPGWNHLGGVVVRERGTPVLADDSAANVLHNLEHVEVSRGASVAALERFWVATPSVSDYAPAQRLLDATGARLVPDDRCYCAIHADSRRDYIEMLPLGSVGGDLDLYWSIYFHELGHWVVLGRRRLCWEGAYSQGELIAEIGAAIQTNHCGIPKNGELDVQGEHVQAWIKGIRDDLAYFTDACSVAERAVKFVVFSSLRQVLHEQVEEPFHGRGGGQPSVSPVRDRR